MSESTLQEGQAAFPFHTEGKPNVIMDIDMPNIGQIEVMQNELGVFRVTFKPLRCAPIVWSATVDVSTPSGAVAVHLQWKAGVAATLWLNGQFAGHRPFNLTDLH